MKNLIRILALIMVCAIALSSYNAINKSNEKSNTTFTEFIGIGEVAPEYSIPDLDGNIISSESLKGKYVVIHFATTWCPFCNAEAPHLEQLFNDFKDKNVQVLIIDVMEPKKLVAQKLRDRYKLTFPVLLDEEGVVASSFAPADALPELSRDEVMLASNLIIDPNGVIRYMSLLDSKNFDAKLVDLKEKMNELLSKDKTPANTTGYVELKDVKTSLAQAGKSSTVLISFQILEGYHIQANLVNDENLIATKLRLEPQEGIMPGQPIFPDWKSFQLRGTEESLQVFTETLDILIPVSVIDNSTDKYTLKGSLYYQACDSWKCFYPRELQFEVTLKMA